MLPWNLRFSPTSNSTFKVPFQNEIPQSLCVFFFFKVALGSNSHQLTANVNAAALEVNVLQWCCGLSPRWMSVLLCVGEQALAIINHQCSVMKSVLLHCNCKGTLSRWRIIKSLDLKQSTRGQQVVFSSSRVITHQEPAITVLSCFLWANSRYLLNSYLLNKFNCPDTV